MSEMERERFEELKEAYVLDALSEEERREFEEYLAAHPERQAEIDELNAVASLLALSPEEHEPSPALRRSLMSAVEAEAEPALAAGRRERRRSSLERLRDFFSPRNLALAAAAALLIGLLSWNVLLRSEIRGSQSDVGELRTVELQGSALPEEASAEIVRLENERAFLVAEDLPPVGEGETLQIWVIDDDGPMPSGLFEPREGVVTVPVTRSLEGAEVVAVTIEPEGGSPRPTRKPMMAAKI
jgi:anti-sigma-K factor RskA